MPQMMPINWLMIFMFNIIMLFLVLLLLNSFNLLTLYKFLPVRASGKVKKFDLKWN